MTKSFARLAVFVLLAVAVVGCPGRETPAPTQPAPTALAAAAATPSPTHVQRPTIVTPPAPRPTVQPTAASTPLPDFVRIGQASGATPVHAQPDAASPVLGQLAPQQLLVMTGTYGDWFEIVFGEAAGGHGWVERSAVQFASPSGQKTVLPSPTVVTASPAAAQIGTVTASRLNVRSAPDVGSPALGQLGQGDQVRIVDRQDGWLQIVYDQGIEGRAWVSAAFVSVGGREATAQPAGPAAERLPGTLVFQDRNGGNIYLMKADGTGLRRLTSGFEPALSPDGRQVAFTRWDEPRGLYVISADGSGERLLFGANRARSATWTPDSQAIVFERNKSSKQCRSTPLGCLTEEEWLQRFGGSLCVDISSRQICFADFPLFTLYFTNLTRFDLATGEARDLPAAETATAPRHHPQQDLIVYLDNDGLATTASRGDNPPQRLVQQPNALGPAAFSPDGSFLVAGRRSHDHWDIWRWTGGGGQPAALTTSPGLAARSPHSVAPVVSPDGRSIAFLTDRRGRWELWVMDAAGSNQRPLAPAALADIPFEYGFASDRTLDWGP